MAEHSTARRDDSAIDATLNTAGSAAEEGELTSDTDNSSLVKEVLSINKEGSTTDMGDEASDSKTGMEDASADEEVTAKEPTDKNDSTTGKAHSARENNSTIPETDPFKGQRGLPKVKGEALSVRNDKAQTGHRGYSVNVESDTSTDRIDPDAVRPEDSEDLTKLAGCASTDRSNSIPGKDASSANNEGKTTTVTSDKSDKGISSAEKEDERVLSAEGKSARTKRQRDFKVLIYERDYKELCAWVLKCEDIETGGDLFGLWADKRTAVIQLVLGPGKQCRRTSASFYQDVPYLERVGSYLTHHEGLCHIGEWHSHHRLGLARPSGGDERTVWSNMPSYKLKRFVIFIANIQSTRNSDNAVNIGCFLFEIDAKSNEELPVVQGTFDILPAARNPLSAKRQVLEHMSDGAEIQNKEDDLGELTLVEAAQRPKCVRHKKEITCQENGAKRKKKTSGQQNTGKNRKQTNQTTK